MKISVKNLILLGFCLAYNLSVFPKNDSIVLAGSKEDEQSQEIDPEEMSSNSKGFWSSMGELAERLGLTPALGVVSVLCFLLWREVKARPTFENEVNLFVVGRKFFQFNENLHIKERELFGFYSNRVEAFLKAEKIPDIEEKKQSYIRLKKSFVGLVENLLSSIESSFDYISSPQHTEEKCFNDFNDFVEDVRSIVPFGQVAEVRSSILREVKKGVAEENYTQFINDSFKQLKEAIDKDREKLNQLEEKTLEEVLAEVTRLKDMYLNISKQMRLRAIKAAANGEDFFAAL